MIDASPRVVHGVDGLDAADGRLFIVLGVFDGLHRGHTYLLRALRREAARRDARPTVVTFDAHPDEVIAGRAPAMLCDADERLVWLARAGVEVVVIAHFDAVVRTTEYDAFVEQIARRVQLAGFLMTPDAAFGYERRGTAEALRELGRRDGFEVAVVPALNIDGRPVRSSVIRDAIARGDLALARRLLGRSVAVSGTVARAEAATDAVAVRFGLPVALPPEGRYRATVEPAWSLDGASARRRVRRTVWVTGGRIAVPAGLPYGPGERVRVALLG